MSFKHFIEWLFGMPCGCVRELPVYVPYVVEGDLVYVKNTEHVGVVTDSFVTYDGDTTLFVHYLNGFRRGDKIVMVDEDVIKMNY